MLGLKVFLLKEFWTFPQILNIAVCFCPVPFHLTVTSVHAGAVLCRCFLEYLFYKGWANGSSLEAPFSKQCNKNIQLLVLFIWLHMQCKYTGWVHKLWRPCTIHRLGRVTALLHRTLVSQQHCTYVDLMIISPNASTGYSIDMTLSLTWISKKCYVGIDFNILKNRRKHS